jgi:hypothetical protein
MSLFPPGYSPASLTVVPLSLPGALNFAGIFIGTFFLTAPAPQVLVGAVAITVNGQYLGAMPLTPAVPLIRASLTFSCNVNVQAQN